MVINNRREIVLARISLTITLTIFAALFYFLANRTYEAWLSNDTRTLLETCLFGIAMFFVAYSNLLYQICLIGHHKRKLKHQPERREELEKIYTGRAPTLSTIIPSYKEERTVIWQTMMSAALAEYPHKNVVLLIDDPYRAKALEDMLKLEDTRLIPGELQTLFDTQLAVYRTELDAFHKRAEATIYPGVELNRLSILFDDVAGWLPTLAKDFIAGRNLDSISHADRFFINAVIEAPIAQHKAHAEALRLKITQGEMPERDFLEQQFARLAALFNVTFSSFERKKYCNLSHEANKAMNLNSYMGIMGKSWKEVETKKGLELREATADEAHFTIPHADYVNTIDADSLMLSDYALRLVHIMEKPGNERIAVIQSPCSSFTGCPDGLERIAGACIDVQFLTHQGYTYWNASFWVGANAMLRRTALDEIKETRQEGNHTIDIFIQDRTVIEDTESTIDLVEKGWKLYNYPERMTFSATPPDFGSLLIQRRRWSNGGLIILPKLLSYIAKAPKKLSLLKELFMRFHYLASTTTGCFVALLFILYPFDTAVSTPLLPLSMIPFFMLYARDLKNAGYKYSDAFRICAMTLMLFPVVTGGVFKQFQQMVSGKKIPFGRTPKITGRTAAPALYCLIEVLLAIAFFAMSAENIAKEQWSQATFCLLNAGLMIYALTYFIGFKAIGEDMVAGIKMRWREAFYHAEIIPLPARWIPSSLSVRTRKRA